MTLRETLAYVYGGLRESYDDPYWWRNRFFEYVLGPVHTRVYPGRSGVRVMDADWDTLVVLDACRADLFAERAALDRYDYRTVTSLGSTTREWVRQNFAGGSFGDTVYVTANPYVSRETAGVFHRLYEPWIDAYDEALGTVRPAATVESARRALDEHPHKRLVVHFMQPHHPFVGAPDLQFEGWQIEDFEGLSDHPAGGAGRAPGPGTPDGGTGAPATPWEALYRGLVDRAAVWEAYGDNLSLVLSAVDDLLAELSGRTVVTSDHGNMAGERTFPLPLRVYGHPEGIRNRQLVEVPWAAVEAGERREVRDDGVGSATRSASATVEERLADLGYV